MNRRHAFASSPVYPLPNTMRNILIYIYLGFKSGFISSFDAIESWKQFKKNALLIVIFLSCKIQQLKNCE